TLKLSPSLRHIVLVHQVFERRKVISARFVTLPIRYCFSCLRPGCGHAVADEGVDDNRSSMRTPLSSVFRIGVCGTASLLLVCLIAAAGEISFPVTLDPSIPNGYVLAAYRHACGGCVPDISDEESNLTGATTAQIGELNLVSLASGPGGGAFSD